MMEDRKLIACNLRIARKEFAMGALAFVVLLNGGNGHESIQICGRSHGGRWIEKWERIANLMNFRSKTMPPAAPLYAKSEWWAESDEGLCIALNAIAGRDALRVVLNAHGEPGRALTDRKAPIAPGVSRWGIFKEVRSA